MRTYQTLSLIGCIIGIFLSLGLVGIMGFLGGTSNVLLNMSESMDPNNPRTQEARREYNETMTNTAPVIAGLFLSLLMYIAAIPITFAIKGKTKAVGIVLLVIGVITTAITNLWGIIPFALLLPAGILALRYKRKTYHRTIEEEE